MAGLDTRLSVIMGTVFVTSYSLVGLLAIWVALGRRPHWFLRAAVWAAILLLLLAIPAYEPVLLFSIQSLVAILPLTAARMWRMHAQGNRPQFSLRDLLLLTVLVAIAAAVAATAPPDMWELWDLCLAVLLPGATLGRTPMTPVEGWGVYLLLGSVIGASTAAAAWIVLSPSRWWLRLVGLLLIPLSALMVLWLALMRASWWSPGGRSGAIRPWTRRSARAAAALLSLLILLAPTVTFCILLAPSPEPPPIVLPDPNGYDDLMHAGQLLASVTIPEPGTATPEQFSAFVTRYGHVFDAVRIGLDRPCVVPLQYTMKDLDNIDTLHNLRDLARAFRAEGEHGRLSGRPEEAVQSCLDLFRLARASSRGGMAIDWLVGIAIEGIGIEAMAALHEELGSEQCREIIDKLKSLNADRQSPDSVADRDDLWERTAYCNADWANHWLWTIHDARSSLRPTYRQLDGASRARLQMLLCALALRSYRLDHGELPRELADLVPEYLPNVPEDPFSGRPLIYRPQDGQYLLYSVGPDRRDDGGKASQQGWSTPGTDLLLDDPPKTP